jgi:hypothetical protein
MFGKTVKGALPSRFLCSGRACLYPMRELNIFTRYGALHVSPRVNARVWCFFPDR